MAKSITQKWLKPDGQKRKENKMECANCKINKQLIGELCQECWIEIEGNNDEE